jgi:RHS repeat-associated protein
MAIEFLLTDQVGTLRAVADTIGNIVKRIDYDSFGNIIADSNPGFSVPFGFAGGLHDRDTGLVRFGYRDYSPELGRFVAKDPIDFAGGDTNLYAYSMSDPVNFIDPLGLETVYEGEASYYANSFEGRKTANGEIFHQDLLTAAMQKDKVPSLPTDARVDYLRLDNDRGVCEMSTVNVRVNDRGPYTKENGRFVPHPTRVIDLSRSAFEQLVGSTRAGVVRVRVTVP